MDLDSEKRQILEKMFEAAVKEKLQQLSRKYDRQTIFNMWVEMVRTGGVKSCFAQGDWQLEMTISQALDCVDRYCHSFEEKIRGTHPERKD